MMPFRGEGLTHFESSCNGNGIQCQAQTRTLARSPSCSPRKSDHPISGMITWECSNSTSAETSKRIPVWLLRFRGERGLMTQAPCAGEIFRSSFGWRCRRLSPGLHGTRTGLVIRNVLLQSTNVSARLHRALTRCFTSSWTLGGRLRRENAARQENRSEEHTSELQSLRHL